MRIPWKIDLALSVALVVSIFVLAFMPQPVNAAPLDLRPGQIITTQAYCNGEKAARILTEAMALDGEKGFVSVMKDDSTNCVIAGLHTGITPFSTRLDSKAWEVSTPDGFTFQFWRFFDAGKNEGFTWTILERPAPVKNQKTIYNPDDRAA